MNKIEISVIVPVYNVEKYLSECLDSLIKQSFKNIEIIIIDDGSFDFSKEIIKKYAEKDDRIKYIFQKNTGLSGARNRGLEVVKGEYIIFIDSDDFIEREMLEKLYGLVKDNNSDIGICDFQYFFSKNNIKPFNIKKRYNIEEETFILNNKYRKKMLSSSNHVCKCLIKSEIIRCYNIKFVEGLLFEDIEFMFKLLSNNLKISIIDTPFYNYRIREGSITSNLSLENSYKHGKSKMKIAELLEEYINLSEEKKRNLEKLYYEITYPLYNQGIIRFLLSSSFKNEERKVEIKKYLNYLERYRKYRKFKINLEIRNIVLEYSPIILNSFTQKYLDNIKTFVKGGK